ncbi:BnaC03g30150D [Brassica napus]|uniref:BnaC03g30150D protein n=1 Tax=Brassica napus TaxID=3708 RepID=A0A078G7E6_BRANA|nr:BnaC03g30150D [Brassica napus]
MTKNLLKLAGCSYIAAYTKACGRVDVDGSRHLLGDHAGLIHLLAITTHEKEKCVENNYGLNSSYKFVPRRMSRLGCKSLQDQSLMVCVWPFLQPQETLRLIGLFHIVL